MPSFKYVLAASSIFLLPKYLLHAIRIDAIAQRWFGVWKPPASIPSAPSFIISSRRRRISISPVVIFPIQETFSAGEISSVVIFPIQETFSAGEISSSPIPRRYSYTGNSFFRQKAVSGAEKKLQVI